MITTDLRATNTYTIREANPNEYNTIGDLLVMVYDQLEGFPSVTEQPQYYSMLRNIGELTHKPGVTLLTAVSQDDKIAGAVIYFRNMADYGSGGTAAHEKNAAGFRLLAVHPSHRGYGLGKLLTQACIDKAKKQGHNTLVIHSTKAMQLAWAMYERMGFLRANDLDFLQEELPVYGFRLHLK
ncbi:GNAT family N-acetyltransferase [Aquimarina intermedia]|uniref:Acetyltransferase (GNAT) family protein n=1 Tax=Aquimarina intermedia TaxID=350814 RepID=A0A5S5BTB5_9FLAO|nr:GNAT family N-acetyltransferase [Aquimarina intermedia]TYP70421.1 acetyltransferase (GNAT) family protein [Aquimarina intermedia]